MKPEYAQKLIAKTIADYNRIADLWSSKRAHLPNDIRDLKKYIAKGEKVLDLGCANGYLIELFSGHESDYTGADVSNELIKISQDKYPLGSYITIQPNEIPVEDNYFDKVFCLSTIHHIPSIEERLKFLAEIRRVLKPSGTLILTAWHISSAMHTWWEENKEKFTENEYFEKNDILYPFKNGDGETEIDRYIHCFDEGELNDLLIQSGFKIVETKIVTRNNGQFGNILTISKKS